MRILLVLLAVSAASCARAPASPPEGTSTSDTATVRREIELWYDENKRAFLAEDVDAIMALRTEDFHAVAPDGTVNDRAAMEFDIDSLEVTGDMARAIVRQHLVRMALRPDGLVHHVETWATQRETWRTTPDGWRLYRVDGVRDQRRLVDGQPD